MNKFEKLLYHRGITNYKLAKDSGLSYMTINDLKNGKSDFEGIRIRTLIDLARGLNMTPSELLNEMLKEDNTTDS